MISGFQQKPRNGRRFLASNLVYPHRRFVLNYNVDIRPCIGKICDNIAKERVFCVKPLFLTFSIRLYKILSQKCK